MAKEKTSKSKLDVDALRQQVPAFFYKRFDLQSKAFDYFLIPIDIGYTYLLRSIRSKFSESDVGDPEIRQELLIKFIGTIADRTYQNIEYPARLICTPAESGFEFMAGPARRQVTVQTVAAPSPVDQEAFGVNFTATPVKNNLILNYYYQRRDTLNLPLRFQITNTQPGQVYVDILFIGYYMPDEDLPEWG